MIFHGDIRIYFDKILGKIFNDASMTFLWLPMASETRITHILETTKNI